LLRDPARLRILLVAASGIVAAGLLVVSGTFRGQENISVSFSVSPSHLVYLLGEQVTFVPRVSIQEVEYRWDFGDNSLSSERSPAHSYAAPGDYTVSLTVVTGDGRSATFSSVIKVAGPSRVEIEGDIENGFRLLVNGQPFVIRGVCYSPTPVGKSPATGYNWWVDPETYLNDFPLIREMGANTIRTYGSNATREALDYAYVNGLYVIMGHWVNHYLDLSVEANRRSEIEKYMTYVRAWKNHPAVLMWSFGNEVEMNYLGAGSGRNLRDWYTLLEDACRAIKAEDNLHPTTYSHIDRLGRGGVGDQSLAADDSSLRSLDIWSLNVYRGASFGDLFEQYRAASRKPLIISEFGCDALDGVAGIEDETTQALYLRSLWSEIEQNASGGVCLGGTVFEWCDEWWKAGRVTVQDNTAQWQNSGYDDPNMNEEWWGITAISPSTREKRPRLAYYVLREIWTGVPAESFTIMIEPAPVRLAQGQTAEVMVRVRQVGNYRGNVQLGVVSLPRGLRVEFLPVSGIPDFESGMRISADPDIQTGSYQLVVYACGADGTRQSRRLSVLVSASSPSQVYVVYSDLGIPENAEVWTWSGADWGLPAGSFDGNHTGESSPEGVKCFMTKSGSGSGNYAGWGVFLIRPSRHTIDLSGYSELRFWVKTPVNLKVEVQDANNRKASRYISSHGWNGQNIWQELVLPAACFSSADMRRIFGVFLITAESPDIVFYVDNVRWV
jgi:hypothetical protein